MQGDRRAGTWRGVGAAVGALLFAPALSGAATIAVGREGGFGDIQAAIDAASNGDTILVAPGTYSVTAPITFQGKAIAVQSESGPAATVIRMDMKPADAKRGSIVIFETGESDRSVLDGFTLTEGKGTEVDTNPFSEGRGGAIYCSHGSRPTLRNLILENNRAMMYGGGLYCDVGCDARVEDCVFRVNFAYKGGAAFIASSLAVERCTFFENWAPSGGGGGVYCRGGGAVFIDSSFLGNKGGDEHSFARDGGGGAIYNENASPRLYNCVFSGNESVNNYGGAVRNFGTSSPTLLNCTFWGNSAIGSEGGAIYDDPQAHPSLSNCILWENRDVNGTGATSQIAGAVPTARSSCIQDDDPSDGSIPFGGAEAFNIDDDPLFIDADGADRRAGTEDDNLRLRPNSPCIDAGDTEALPPSVAFDRDGDPRRRSRRGYCVLREQPDHRELHHHG